VSLLELGLKISTYPSFPLIRIGGKGTNRSRDSAPATRDVVLSQRIEQVLSFGNLLAVISADDFCMSRAAKFTQSPMTVYSRRILEPICAMRNNKFKLTYDATKCSSGCDSDCARNVALENA
jgi:hypothetical protein